MVHYSVLFGTCLKNGITNFMEQRLRNALTFLKNRIGTFLPELLIIPGSGWDHFMESIEEPLIVEYSDIPDFPRATFHKGAFTFGKVAGVNIVTAGRLHYYEGIPVEDTVMPVRVMRMLGVKKLLLTNASGGINPAFAPGSFMVIRDHISWGVPSPLRGKNLDFLGPRFPDMSAIYSPRLREAIFRAGRRCGIELNLGTYIQTEGPQFETPAEIRLMSTLGADAVGMSTVPEAVAACHCGMEIAGISCISNSAAGIAAHPLSVEDITLTAQKAAPQMSALLKECIVEFSNSQE